MKNFKVNERYIVGVDGSFRRVNEDGDKGPHFYPLLKEDDRRGIFTNLSRSKEGDLICGILWLIVFLSVVNAL